MTDADKTDVLERHTNTRFSFDKRCSMKKYMPYILGVLLIVLLILTILFILFPK